MAIVQTSSHQLRQIIPQINAAYWGFMLGGMVRIPLTLSYTDLTRQPGADVPCVITCVGNPPGEAHYESATWQGVYLQTLLDQVIIAPEARFARFYAADGYNTSIPIEKLLGALLIYALNNQPLSPEQGFPVRLVVPGLYGYKMPKWIQRIELSDTPLPGTWEARGWSPDGVAQTTSTILSPRHLQPVSGNINMMGTAYAGERQITHIEISIDDSAWMPVSFTPAQPYEQTHWSIDWTAPRLGDYRVKVRATDSSGFTQTDHSPVFPNGSSAIHAITIRVMEDRT